jgi:dTDP-4-amino-4,6-dideoxygalactose transaminase
MSLPSGSLKPERTPSGTFEWRVPLSALSYTSQEMSEVMKVLQSGWWTCGPETRDLEAALARRLGVRHAIAVANGTAALHLAHVALELKPGDEVITPSLSFVAAANIILHAGATPHFADVASLDAPLVSAVTLERAITPRTRGICVMHYGGYPCAMDQVMTLARERGLWVIEDAAHAPGASWDQVPCGSWGDIGCFSFFGNKNLTCGEGGLVTTQRDDIAEKVRRLRSHGMDSLTWDRYQGHQFSYDVTAAGFNYRLDDVRAAILKVQLGSLDRVNRLRQERVAWYRRLLDGDPRWSIPFTGWPGVSAHHLMVVVLTEGIDRERVMREMKMRGIQTSIHYPPIHEFSFYRRMALPRTELSVTEMWGQRALTLPLFPDLSRQDVNLVCASLSQAVDLCS